MGGSVEKLKQHLPDYIYEQVKKYIKRRKMKVNGFSVYNDEHDSLGLRTKRGFFNQAEMTIVEHYVSAGDTVVDVGANIGLYTLHLAKCVGLQGKVYSFEPFPESIRLLKKNLIKNNLSDRVVFSARPASDSEHDMILQVSSYNFGMNRLTNKQSSKEGGVKVKTIPLDKVIFEPVRFMKIDVEGHELCVLRGAKRIIQDSKDIIILFEYNRDGFRQNNYTLQKLLTEFEGLYLYNLGGNLIDFAQADDFLTSTGKGYVNLILSKKKLPGLSQLGLNTKKGGF